MTGKREYRRLQRGKQARKLELADKKREKLGKRFSRIARRRRK